jgi:hypothetical protein
MAKIVSMKNEESDDMPTYCGSKYGYGLTLALDEEQCKKLGISKALRAGTMVTITAKAVVTSSTEQLDRDTDEKSGTEIRLSLQITDMGMNMAGMMRNAAAELYGSGE